MGQIRDGAKWTLMTLEGKLLYLVTVFAEKERQGKRWTIWVYHSPRELGMGLLETWPYHVDLCGAINLFQRLEKNK